MSQLSPEFSKLPLYRVGLRLVLNELPENGIDLATLSAKLEESGRNLKKEEETDKSLAWSSADDVLRGLLRDGTLMVFWYREHKADYPRYSALYKELEEYLVLMESVASFSVRVAGIMYTQLEVFGSDEALSFEEYLAKRYRMPIISESETYSYELAWRAESGYDFRLSLERFKPDPDDTDIAVLLSSSCGGFCSKGKSVMDTLNEVHDALQPEFVSMIAEDTLQRWGFKNE